MKNFFPVIGVLVIAVLGNFQCDYCRSSCQDYVRFRIMDAKTGQNVYFGSQATHNPDSLYVISKEVLKQFGTKGFGPAYFNNFDSMLALTNYGGAATDTFYLKDGFDWDTIALRFNYKNTDCCKPYYEVKEIDFNGLKAVHTGDFWIFNKP